MGKVKLAGEFGLVMITIGSGVKDLMDFVKG
jgi:hypothetical protein